MPSKKNVFVAECSIIKTMDRHSGAVKFSYPKKAVTQVPAKGIEDNPFNQAYDKLKVNSVLLSKDD